MADHPKRGVAVELDRHEVLTLTHAVHPELGQVTVLLEEKTGRRARLRVVADGFLIERPRHESDAV